MSTAAQAPWTREEFERQLRRMEKYYHINHELQVRMAEGKLDKAAIQGWVANRFYYQVSIPVKDASIMANCRDREVRRHWVQRIIDHDGTTGNEGGIEAWLQLGEAVGLERDEVLSQRHLLPGVRFAVDAYVNFARRATWQEAASSSLTELFAPAIHQNRLDTWPQHYPWVKPQGYRYFRKRLSEARRDVEHGLQITLDYYRTRAAQERMLQILKFKLDVLWTMCDAMWARKKGAGLASAELLPGARIVRAFNAIGAARMGAAHEEPGRIGMPIAGDDTQAIEVASRLIRDIGYEPVLIGGLAMGKYLMPGTPLSGENTPEEIRKIVATLN